MIDRIMIICYIFTNLIIIHLLLLLAGNGDRQAFQTTSETSIYIVKFCGLSSSVASTSFTSKKGQYTIYGNKTLICVFLLGLSVINSDSQS